ncbi:hypothetical protein ILUMI_15448, partial [Ignelater luminosus]
VKKPFGGAGHIWSWGQRRLKFAPSFETNKQQKRRLIATEMDFWRSSDIPRIDRVRNDTIKELMGVEKTIIDPIETKRLQWSGHLEKMDENTWPKKV